MLETDPGKMVVAMIVIPGVTVIEARTTPDTLDLLVETEVRPVRCPSCSGDLEAAGAELEDLVPSSAWREGVATDLAASPMALPSR
jgi:hypothetical protein